MLRKPIPEQNDISLIFGNLPKRLQQKIAADCSVAVTTAVYDRENKTPKNAQLAEITRINSSKVNCTSGSESNESEKKTQNDIFIPGILRVNAVDAAQLKQTRKIHFNNGKKNNHNRRWNKAHNKNNAIDYPVSPAHLRLTTEHPSWFEQLTEMLNHYPLIQLYDQLMVIQERDLILLNWKNFCEIHEKLQNGFKKLLLQQLKYIYEHKIDTFFWKLLFYNIRDYLKRKNSDMANERLLGLIDQTNIFYHLLYNEFDEKYLKKSNKLEGIAKVVGQRLLICLGDLGRYRACLVQCNEFSAVIKYYNQAHAMLPANGAPYNQMAIVAMYIHKPFDAVYYYMRSLASSKIIATAKESLLDLFDDIRKKYEEDELKCSPLRKNGNRQKKTKCLRKEVWIYPDGARHLHRTDEKCNNIVERQHFDKIAPDELLRRTKILYLYLLGKIYTGIGMEYIYQHLRKLYILLSAALKQNNLLSRTYILKMVALNIFVMEHNKQLKSRREIRYHAFNFCNMIFGVILHKANEIFITPIGEISSIEELNDDFTELNTVLQYVKIYVQWLELNVDIWEAVRNEDHAFIDCWQELEQLFENIGCMFANHIEEYATTLSEYLDEDKFLNGFLPISQNIIDVTLYVSLSERLQFIKRIKQIEKFQPCYEEHKNILLGDLNSSFVLEELNTEMEDALKDICIEEKKETDIVERLVPELINNMDNDNNIKNKQINDLKIKCNDYISTTENNLTQLNKLKLQLEEKEKAKQMCKAKLQEILKFVDTKIYIEVRPKYLMPDTNCFIDCLNEIEQMAQEYQFYTIVLPLTVIKELDGLSKGIKVNFSKYTFQKKRLLHYDEVTSCARKSLEFIQRCKNKIRCVTTRGSIINPSLFSLVEEDYASNDDKILATAVSLSKTMSTETCKDGKCLIQTEFVLITTDRNLRVKALARNLAVSALNEFIQWAKNCNAT